MNLFVEMQKKLDEQTVTKMLAGTNTDGQTYEQTDIFSKSLL